MAPNAQGLMGLMAQGRAPQPGQPPMPSPMKASPMAGLGSVEDRVAAYRGNSKPLEDRYAMSQDLLDLLALQQIKSERESAARQMQMQMAQQQVAEGQAPMTVAQQREKEVMDLTKTELAQQRGETAGQQQQQQQDNMKKLLSGIAQAPGAAAAAQPRMMAAGGIVAFKEGDPVEDPRRARREGESFMDYRRRMMELDTQLRRERDQQRRQTSEAERQRRLAERGEVIPPSPFLERAPLPEPREPIAPGVADPREEQALRGVSVAQGAAPAGPSAPPPPPAAAGPGAPAAPAAPAARAEMPPPATGGALATGLASLNLPAGESAIAGTPTDPLAQLLRREATAGMTTDPQAVRLAEEKRQRDLLMFPEEQRRRQQQVDLMQRMYEQEFDPERQRQEGLKRFLIGAGGRRYGEFGAGAGAAMGYDEAQRRQQLDRLKGLEEMRQGIFSLQKGAVEKGIAGGQSAYEKEQERRRQAMASGATQYSTESGALQKGLDREQQAATATLDRQSRERIAAENARLQNETNKAMREGNLLQRRESLIRDYDRAEQVEIRGLNNGPTAKAIANLEQLRAMNESAFTPAQKTQLANLKRELEEQRDAIRTIFDASRERLNMMMRGAGGEAGGVSLSAADRALIDKYKR